MNNIEWIGLVVAMTVNLFLARHAYMRMARRTWPKTYDDSKYERRNSPHPMDWGPILAAVALTPVSMPIIALLSLKIKMFGTNRQIWERKSAKRKEFQALLKRVEIESREIARLQSIEQDRIVRELGQLTRSSSLHRSIGIPDHDLHLVGESVEWGRYGQGTHVTREYVYKTNHPEMLGYEIPKLRDFEND